MKNESTANWRYIEAVFVADPCSKAAIPHPQWPHPIGKQLVTEHRSTTRFLRVLQAIRRRQWLDQSVNGTYEWRDNSWRLVSETTLTGNELRCPDEIPIPGFIADTRSEL